MAKQYKALFRRFKDQSPDEYLAFVPVRRGDTWETSFAELAARAKPENWNFNRPEFCKPNVNYPILQSYLNFTFLRLQDQGKVMYNQDEGMCCFNTGLQTGDEKDLFAIFSMNPRRGDGVNPDWTLFGFYDSYSREVNRFRPLPEIATYIQDPRDLVFDTAYDVDVNVGHILDDPENQNRLPEALRSSRQLAIAAIEGALKLISEKVRRNYKTAIPVWYTTRQKVQLLLPLCIIQPDRADLALLADRDDRGKVYRIRTALRMDMAYNNARLITRPDREWLDP